MFLSGACSYYVFAYSVVYYYTKVISMLTRGVQMYWLVHQWYSSIVELASYWTGNSRDTFLVVMLRSYNWKLVKKTREKVLSIDLLCTFLVIIKSNKPYKLPGRHFLSLWQ